MAGYLHTHATADLPRKERIVLLRQPGGLSGKSWLGVAEIEVPLATALLEVGQVGLKGEALRTLLAYGEASVTLRAMAGMIPLGGAAEVKGILAEAEGLPREVNVLKAWVAQEMQLKQLVYGSARMPLGFRVPNVGDSEPKISVADRLSWVGIPPRLLLENQEQRNIALAYSGLVPSLGPLVQFCQSHCQKTQDYCTAVGASLLWGHQSSHLPARWKACYPPKPIGPATVSNLT